MKIFRFYKAQHWIAILGGIIFFISWYVERNFENHWESQKIALTRSQLVIDITENRRALFEVSLLNEIYADSSIQHKRAYYHKNLGQTYLNLLAWNKGRAIISDEYNNLIGNKNDMADMNQRLFEAKEYDLLERNFNLIASVFNKKYMEYDADFVSKLDKVNVEQEKSSFIFSILYILGSILLGLSYLIANYQMRKLSDE